MDGAIQSFLSGIPFLLTHFGVTLVMLVVGVFVYVKITSHDEMALIRDGNSAAAVSLSGAILGLAFPLAFCRANSVNIYDIVIWGIVALVIQLITFLVIDLWLRDLSQKINLLKSEHLNDLNELNSIIREIENLVGDREND